MARFGMAIDTVRCVGCMDCVVACQDRERRTRAGYCRDWIVDRGDRGKLPGRSQLEIRSERCNHCDDPPCVLVLPDRGQPRARASARPCRSTPDHCIGCKACHWPRVPTTPRFIHPGRLCGQVHVLRAPRRRRAWIRPASPSARPTACTFGDLDDPE